MLSDVLSDMAVELKEAAVHYSTGVFAKHFDQQTREALDRIIEQIVALRIYLDTPPPMSENTN